jgi:general secretion pathway protein J
MRVSAPQRGFTLLELLIALALIGLMTVLLFGALRFASKAWASTEERTERDASIRLVYQYLADRMEQARPVSAYLESEGENVFFFTGQEGALEFVSPMPAHLGSGGLYIIRLQEQGSGSKKQLLLSRWLFHPEVLEGVKDLPEWTPLSAGGNRSGNRSGKEDPAMRAYYSETTLVDELKDVEISYFGLSDPKDETGDWWDDWEDRDYLPWLVKIQIKDSRGAWPDMIFELPST